MGTGGRRRFGTFEIDLATGELRRGGVKRRIQEQPFKILAMLLERPGEMVTRDALRERLWPANTFVDFEHGLNAAIRRLRNALDDSSENPLFVETLARRGYRFIAPVTPIDTGVAVDSAATPGNGTVTSIDPTDESQADAEGLGEAVGPSTVPPTEMAGTRSRRGLSRGMAAAAAGAVLLALGWASWTFRSGTDESSATASSAPAQLAVLPLRVLTGTDSDKYLGIGIADAILTRLANVRSIRIRPTSAILSFDGPNVDPAAAGRQLQVAHVLTGTVQRVEAGYRFNLQLVRTADGAPEWGHNVDVARQDLFTVEDRVSDEVAAALQVRLSPTERSRISRRYTDNVDAYEQYLEGRALLANYSDSNLRQAMDRFQRALQIDPSYVLAESGLAIAAGIFSVRFAYEREARDWGRQAETYARRALAQDPNLGEAHLALASAAGTLYHNFDWPLVISEARAALAINPNLDLAHSAIARALYHMGLFDESEAESAQAEERSGGTNVEVTRVRLYNQLLQGHFDEAARRAEALLARTNAPVIQQYLGLAAFYNGDASRAQQVLSSIRRRPGGSDPDIRSIASLAAIQGATGQPAAAEQSLRMVMESGYIDHHVAYSLGATHAQLGRPPDAVKWLRVSSDTGFPCYPWFAADRLLDPIRKDPEFMRLMSDLRNAHAAAKARYAAGQ